MSCTPGQWSDIQIAIDVALQVGFFLGAVFGVGLWLAVGGLRQLFGHRE